MASRIIGLVGLPGSGKGTVAEILRTTYGAEVFRMSGILSDILKRLWIEKKRDNQIALSEALRGTFGQDILSSVMKQDIANATSDIVVIDGIRRVSDCDAIAQLPNFTLVEVTAPPRIRYERMTHRGEKAGELTMTYEQFEAHENASTERSIPEVAARATERLDNGGTNADLEQQVADLLQKLGVSKKT